MSSLPPTIALAYLRELSADFRAGIVLDADHELLTGDATLQAPATRLLDAHPHARELHGIAESGAQVFAVAAEHGAIVVVTGPHALPGVTRRDMRTALYGNARESGQGVSCERPNSGLVEPLVTAAADAFRP